MTVVGNDPDPILYAGGAGHGGGRGVSLPAPEATLPGGDKDSILGGPNRSNFHQAANSADFLAAAPIQTSFVMPPPIAPIVRASSLGRKP